MARGTLMLLKCCWRPKASGWDQVLLLDGDSDDDGDGDGDGDGDDHHHADVRCASSISAA